MTEISLLKKYKTRDGRDVRLLCTDGPGEYPVIGTVKGCMAPHSWSNTGKHDLHYDETPKDLIEVPNTRKQTFYRRKWGIVFGNKLLTNLEWYTSKEEFDKDWEGHMVNVSDEWEELTIEVPV